MRSERVSSLFFSGLFCLVHALAFSSDWLVSSKKENGIVNVNRQDVEISVNDDGQLSIIAKVYEETEHFNQNANMYSQQSVGYSETFTEITDLQAYTQVLMDKGKYKKVSVDHFKYADSQSDGIFYDDHKKISFIYPSLKPQSKTVLSYKKIYKEPRLWGYFLFSSYFPVKMSSYNVVAPENVKLNYFLYGIDPSDVNFSKQTRNGKVYYSWTSEHLNKIEISQGSDGILNSAPHMIIYIDSYEFKGKTYNVLGDVNDLHTWYQNFLDGIDEQSAEVLEKVVNKIIEGKSSEIEKVEAIYQWVQQNIKYIAIEDGLGGFKPRGASTVFNRRYGDCKDMSYLLHNMLSIADIPSNLAWIGTTSIPYSHREVPTPMSDNHMICTYTHDGKYYFLDATDQYNMLGMPTTHIQGREALVHKGTSNFELIDVPVVPADQNTVIDSVFMSVTASQLEGHGKVTYSGYSRIPVTNNLENLNELNKKEFLNTLLKKGSNKFRLLSVKTRFVAEKDLPLMIDYDFVLDDYSVTAGDEIIINPHIKKMMENGLVDISTVKKDIYYPYKNINTNVLVIRIPENYTASHLPVDCAYESDEFGFSLSYSMENNKITVLHMVHLDTLRLRPESFDAWNTMIKKLFDAYKDSIVLQKI